MSTNQKSKTNRRRVKQILIGLFTLVVIAAVLVVYLVTRGPDRSIANTVTHNMQNSQVGQTVDQIVPKANLLSTMLLPSGDKWWQQLSNYMTTDQLHKLKYSSLGNPTGLGFVELYNSNSKAQFYFATPVAFLAYKTTTEAATVVKTITAQSTSLTPYYALRIGNNVVILPDGNIDTETFVLKNYKPSTQTQPVTQAYWHISWNVLAAYTSSIQSTSYQNTYAQVLKQAGLSSIGKTQVYWDGYSTDGTTWTGENNSTSDTPYLNLNAINGAKIWSIIDSTQRDAAIRSSDGKVSDTGITIQYQSAVENYIAIQTATSAAGYITDPTTHKITKPKALAGDKNTVKITMDPNRWFQYMLRNTTDVWTLTNYQTLTLTLNKTNNSMNMKFTSPVANVQ